MLVREALGNDSHSAWNVMITRNLKDWEVEEYVNLLHTLTDIQLCTNDDRLCWNLKKNGEFSVKSYYQFLEGYRTVNQHDFSSKIIWKSGNPPPKDLFLCLGSCERTYFNNRQSYEKRFNHR